jgi:hypothetical protein
MAQISMEAALAACREKLGEQAYENALLRAQVTELEKQLSGQQPAEPQQDPTEEPAPPMNGAHSY